MRKTWAQGRDKVWRLKITRSDQHNACCVAILCGSVICVTSHNFSVDIDVKHARRFSMSLERVAQGVVPMVELLPESTPEEWCFHNHLNLQGVKVAPSHKKSWTKSHMHKAKNPLD
eukprot:4238002-Amphidinium_carterae.1